MCALGPNCTQPIMDKNQHQQKILQKPEIIQRHMLQQKSEFKKYLDGLTKTTFKNTPPNPQNSLSQGSKDIGQFPLSTVLLDLLT